MYEMRRLSPKPVSDVSFGEASILPHSLTPRPGTLYDLDICWTVLSGADDGLKSIVHGHLGTLPKRSRNEERLKCLWPRYIERRNPALVTLLPKPRPPTLQHHFCETAVGNGGSSRYQWTTE